MNNIKEKRKQSNKGIKCKYCGRTHNIIKKGVKGKYKKQIYYCKNCKKYFSLGKDKRIKRDEKLKELAILLYSHNSSLRSIQSIIEKFYNTKISFSVICNWIKTMSKLLKIDVEMKEVEDNEDYNKEIEDNINDKGKEEKKENKELKESNVDNNSSKKENKDSISNNIKDNDKNNNKDEDNVNCYDNINSNISSNSNNNNNINTNNITEKNKPKPKPKTIDILELDELYSYFYDLKKNEKRESKYGLLLIGTEIKLLHLK